MDRNADLEKRLWWLYTLAATIYLSSAITQFALPLRVKDLGGSSWLIGLIVGVKLAVSAPLALPLGAMGDAIGHRRLMLMSVPLLLVSNLLMAVSDSVVVLFFASGLNGLGSAGALPALSAMVVSAASGDRKADAIGYLTLSTNLGLSLGPGLAGMILERGSFEIAFIAAAFVTVAGLVPFRFGVARDPGRLRANEAMRRVRVRLRAVSSHHEVWPAWLVSFGISLVWGTNLSLLPVTARTMGISAAVIGLLFTLQSAVNTASRVPLAWVLKRGGHTVVLGTMAIVVYAAYLAVVPSVTSSLWLGAMMASSVLFVALGYMVAQTYLARNVSEEAYGMAMGGYTTAFYCGAAAGPMLCGAVASVAGYPAGFRTVALCAVLPALAARFVDRKATRAAATAAGD